MKRRKPPKYAENKKAFDTVMQSYRDYISAGSVGAMSYGDGCGTTPNAAKPSPLDFRCDVDRVIKKCVSAEQMSVFVEAYINYDSLDSIDHEVHAHRLLGEPRHNLEQGMGAEFVRRKLFPTSGSRGYFHTLRRGREEK